MWFQVLLWVIFNIFVVAMLALDLGVFHRTAHVIHIREALLWCVLWMTLALLFNVGIYFWHGSEPALEFLTGYLLEYSLSVDNIFVFLMIFSYFRVPYLHQHKVLFWGILGALIMRALFILTGITLIQKFHWVIYIMGGFLVLTGINIVFQRLFIVAHAYERSLLCTHCLCSSRRWCVVVPRLFRGPAVERRGERAPFVGTRSRLTRKRG